MVGNDDPVEPLVYSDLNVLPDASATTPRNLTQRAHLHGQEPLHHHRPLPILPQEPHILPRPIRPIHDLLPPLHRQLNPLPRQPIPLRIQLPHPRRVVREPRRVLLRVRLPPLRLHERRVRQPDLDPDPVHEGQERAVEVRGAPPDRHRVDGDDERAVPARLRAVQKGQRVHVAARPVDLEPAPAVGAVRVRDRLERARGRPGDDEGDVERARGACGGEFGVGVEARLGADGGDEEGRGIRDTKESRLYGNRKSAPRSGAGMRV